MKKKAGKIKFLDLFITVLFILVAAVSVDLFRRDLLQTFNLQNVEPVGKVVVKKNTVQRRFSDRVLWDRLASESPVYSGDLIRVAEISSAVLYLEDSSIELDENTLIRIIPGEDGEGLQIILTEGSIVYIAGEDSNITLDLNGRRIVPSAGNVVNASIADNGLISHNVTENVTRYVREGNARQIDAPFLLSPAVNSVLRFGNGRSFINFQWTNLEEALSYILEVSSSPDFLNPRIHMSSTMPSLAVTDIEDGLWYWRVKPVFPQIFYNNAVFSATSFFRVQREMSDNAVSTGNISFSQWLAIESPPLEFPPDLPPEFASMRPADVPAKNPVQLTQVIEEEKSEPAVVEPEPVQVEPEREPERVAAAPPRRVQPAPRVVQPLPAPRNLRPAGEIIIGAEGPNAIVFNWTAVQGANAYVFSLRRQNGTQVIRDTRLGTTSYTLNNLGILDRGTFIWQVEAIAVRGAAIERRGTASQSSFNISFPAPTRIQIEDMGVLYGN